MPIITKPASIEKDAAATMSLDKSALAAVSMVAADPYFSDSSNWSRVHVYYKSSAGNQREMLRFDATEANPETVFLVSQKARDGFQVQKILILDFDNGSFEVPRSALNTAEFDVDMGAAPVSALLTRDFSLPAGGLGSDYYSNAGNISNGTLNVLYGTADGQGSIYAFFPNTFTYGPTYKLRLTISGAISSNFLIGTSGQYPPRAVTSQEVSQGYVEFTWVSNGYGSIIFHFGSTNGSYSTAQFTKVEVFAV